MSATAHARIELVYGAYRGLNCRSGWLPMADVDPKLRRDITPMPGADPLSDLAPEAPAVVGYLASFAMTAVATIVAVGVDSAVTILTSPSYL